MVDYKSGKVKLKKEGEKKTNLAGVQTVLFQWVQPGTVGGNCTVMFQNGKVVSTSQFGLK